MNPAKSILESYQDLQSYSDRRLKPQTNSINLGYEKEWIHVRKHDFVSRSIARIDIPYFRHCTANNTHHSDTWLKSATSYKIMLVKILKMKDIGAFSDSK